MAGVRTCPVCGKRFKAEGKSQNRKYCCEECSVEANRRKQESRRRQEKEECRKAAGPAMKRSPLKEMARKARAAGMSYGQYVGLEYLRIEGGDIICGQKMNRRRSI